MQELGSPDEAQSAFSTSIMLFQQLPEGWLSWGTFCDARSRAAAGVPAEAASWVQNAAAAYLQVRPGAAGRFMGSLGAARSCCLPAGAHAHHA